MEEIKNIQQISDSYLCSACGACNAICKKDAIEFKFTNIGRKYAQVNEKCINCGLCLKVCPSMDTYRLTSDIEDRYVGEIRNVYIGRSTNATIYQNAQSGGACTALLTYLFETKKIDGAVVCRMVFGFPPTVKGVVVTSASELLETQKSCYTPVDLLSALKTCSNFKSLAVVGLPCHIEAVENLMRTSRSFSNITYRLGLICDRTLAAGIQDFVCSLSPSNESFKIHWRGKGFRSKKQTFIYKNAPVILHRENGTDHMVPRHVRTCLKDMFTSPRCRVCYDKLNLFSDITLGDPWKMSGVDWENGDSLIIARTEKGEELLNEALSYGALSMKPADWEEMLGGQLIAQRREQVKKYSSAYRSLSFDMESPILETYDGNTEKEKKSLLAFIDSEGKTKEEIRKQALRIVKKYERSQSLPHKMWHKTKKAIKKIWTK